MNADGTGNTVSESGVQNQSLPLHNHAVYFCFTLVRANTPLRFVLSPITSTWSLLQYGCNRLGQEMNFQGYLLVQAIQF